MGNGTDITSVKSTASERRIGIPEYSCKDIQALIDYYKSCYEAVKQTDYLFSGRYPTIPMAPTNINLQFKKAIKKTGLPEICVHYFRHSHASLLINKSVSLYVVSKHLGHKSIQTTANICGHLYPSSEAAITNAPDNIYKSNKREVNKW